MTENACRHEEVREFGVTVCRKCRAVKIRGAWWAGRGPEVQHALRRRSVTDHWPTRRG